jgi:hypothetical protein
VYWNTKPKSKNALGYWRNGRTLVSEDKHFALAECRPPSKDLVL